AWRSLDNDAFWKLIVYQVAVVGGSSSYDRLVASPSAQEALQYDRLRVAGTETRARVIHRTLRHHGVRYVPADIRRCPKTRALTRNLAFLAAHARGPTGYLKDLSRLNEDARVARVMHDLSYIKLKGARDLLAELDLVRNVIALD